MNTNYYEEANRLYNKLKSDKVNSNFFIDAYNILQLYLLELQEKDIKSAIESQKLNIDYNWQDAVVLLNERFETVPKMSNVIDCARLLEDMKSAVARQLTLKHNKSGSYVVFGFTLENELVEYVRVNDCVAGRIKLQEAFDSNKFNYVFHFRFEDNTILDYRRVLTDFAVPNYILLGVNNVRNTIEVLSDVINDRVKAADNYKKALESKMYSRVFAYVASTHNLVETIYNGEYLEWAEERYKEYMESYAKNKMEKADCYISYKTVISYLAHMLNMKGCTVTDVDCDMDSIRATIRINKLNIDLNTELLGEKFEKYNSSHPDKKFALASARQSDFDYCKKALEYTRKLVMSLSKEFNVISYLQEKAGDDFVLIPAISINTCKTEQDCIDLLERLGI